MSNEAPVVVALDVDSTLMTHEYPLLGEDIGAIPWLKQVMALSPRVKFILCTMRSGPSADLARSWLERKGIPVWAVNFHPTQHLWTQSPKPYFHVLVDDRALGIPLKDDGCVDWDQCGPMLLAAVRSLLQRMSS